MIEHMGALDVVGAENGMEEFPHHLRKVKLVIGVAARRTSAFILLACIDCVPIVTTTQQFLSSSSRAEGAQLCFSEWEMEADVILTFTCNMLYYIAVIIKGVCWLPT